MKRAVDILDVYIPMDRRRALVQGARLPDRVEGAALFIDISGFTPLTEALARDFGPGRGAEELTRLLNRIFDALIAELHHYGGSVIGFAGDAMTCWFDRDTGLKATACALAMQQRMDPFDSVSITSGRTVSLGIKAAVAVGSARRFVVGNPHAYVIDTLAGATLDSLAQAEHHAERGEVVLTPATVASLGDQVELIAWRDDDETDDRFGVVGGLISQVPESPWQAMTTDVRGEEQLRTWLMPPVYERLRAGRGEFLAEFRPAAILFLRFGGIDYDGDEGAGSELDAYIRWVQSILAEYESYLLHLTIGDKGSYLSAGFGAPIAHEDDAIRAVSAALELRTVPDDLYFIDRVQIGINQGRMLAGAYGGNARRTYGVLGDDVNLAARLMQAADPGQILVSQVVQQATGDAFDWQSLPAIRVKGKTEPVTVLSPIRAKQRRVVRLHEVDYALPMVGREAELALIEQKLEVALQGRGQIVGITGEAGIGKSRLVAEVVRTARNRQLAGYASECESYGTNTSYLVWRAIWRALFDIDPAWEIAEQIRTLEKELERIDPALVPRLPLLGVVLNLPIPDNDLTRSFDAKLRKQSLEALLVDCLRARARTTPLLFVLEDSHWLDPLSHDLTEVVGRALADLPVMLILVYRPPEAEYLQAPRVSSLPHFTQVALTDFTPHEAERLIALKLEQFAGPQTKVSPKLMERIMTRAQGNPFYIEELLNYLRDRDISPQDSRALEQLDLPTSLHSLILSRLDQRTASQKIVLRVASVIGRLFRAALLWGMYPELGTPERVKADLETLCHLDLTQADTPEPELAYLFKHIVTQEVAYESLPYATRAMLHEQLALFIERVDSESLNQYIDLLAYHFERTDNEPKKREYLRKAGEAAQADYANQAAIDYYQRLLPLLSGTERAEVLCSLGEVLTLVGQYDQALDCYFSARALAEDRLLSLDQVCPLAELHRKIAEVYERRSEYDVALEWLDRGLGYLDEEEPTIEAARIYILRAGVYYRQGKTDETIAWLQKSLPVASKIESREGQQAVGHVYHLLSSGYYRQGELDRAAEFARKSVQVYEQIDDIAGQAKGYNNLGIAYDTQGDWGNAHDAFRKSLTINRKIGDILQQGFATNNLGMIDLHRGEWAEAATFFEESNTVWKQLGAAYPDAVTLGNLAEVYINQGNWDEARACLSRSQAIFTEIGSEGDLPELERRWGQFYLRTGALDEALAHARRSVDLALTQEARVEEGMSCRVLGQIHLARGEGELAETALRESLQILSELNSEYEVAKTTLSLVHLMLKDNRPEAQAHLERALQTFEKLSAQAYLVEALVLAEQLESRTAA